MYKNEEEFLKNYNKNDYDLLSVTTDVLILSIDDEDTGNYRKTSKKHMSVLLVKRTDYPYKDKWSLPGGFINIDEDLEESPKRVLKRETNLDNIYLEQLYTFGNAKRDPRMRILSTSYIALINRKNLTSELSPNASWFNIRYFEEKNDVIVFLDNKSTELKFRLRKNYLDDNQDNIFYSIVTNDDIAFDHPIIIYMGIERIKNKINYTDIAFKLMPEYFTLGDLQQVYEVILNKKLLDPAFRRIIASKVVKTDKIKKGEGHRPSALFKYNNIKKKGEEN